MKLVATLLHVGVGVNSRSYVLWHSLMCSSLYSLSSAARSKHWTSDAPREGEDVPLPLEDTGVGEEDAVASKEALNEMVVEPGTLRVSTIYSLLLSIAGRLANKKPRESDNFSAMRLVRSRRRAALVSQGRMTATGAEDQLAGPNSLRPRVATLASAPS